MSELELGRERGAHEDRLGSVYLHPRELSTLTWSQSRGLRFVERPAEHASDVHDLDGVVRFTRMPPAGLRFDEQTWRDRRADVTLDTITGGLVDWP